MKKLIILTYCFSYLFISIPARASSNNNFETATNIANIFIDNLNSLHLEPESLAQEDIAAIALAFTSSPLMKDLQAMLKKEKISKSMFLTIYHGITSKLEHDKTNNLLEKLATIQEEILTLNRELSNSQNVVISKINRIDSTMRDIESNLRNICKDTDQILRSVNR